MEAVAAAITASPIWDSVSSLYTRGRPVTTAGGRQITLTSRLRRPNRALRRHECGAPRFAEAVDVIAASVEEEDGAGAGAALITLAIAACFAA